MSDYRPLSKYALVAILFIGIGLWLAPFFAGTKPIPAVFWAVGSVEIYWYGVTMALGITAAGLLALQLIRSGIGKLTEDQAVGAMIWGIIGGLIGARLLFVLLKWDLYRDNLIDILNIHGGGMSLHGALLGGLVATFIYSRLTKLNWNELADTLVVGIPLGQAIGRFGNFFNQEAYGGPTTLPWKMFIEQPNRPENFVYDQYFHPTFLYEAILLLILLGFLWQRVHKTHPPGQIFILYIGLYSLIRFGIEFFRVDSDVWGFLTVAQWASLILMGWSIIWNTILRGKRGMFPSQRSSGDPSSS